MSMRGASTERTYLLYRGSLRNQRCGFLRSRSSTDLRVGRFGLGMPFARGNGGLWRLGYSLWHIFRFL